MESLTRALTELQATIVAMKSKSHHLKFILLAPHESHIKEAKSIGENVQLQIQTLQTAHDEFAATVESQEQDQIKRDVWWTCIK
jgi:hypothetical protein